MYRVLLTCLAAISSFVCPSKCTIFRCCIIDLPFTRTTFEFWGYQRSDAGLYSISFDGGATTQIDVFNATATGNDGPRRLFFKTGLTNAIHSVRIVNLLDSRSGKFGQMNGKFQKCLFLNNVLEKVLIISLY